MSAVIATHPEHGNQGILLLILKEMCCENELRF